MGQLTNNKTDGISFHIIITMTTKWMPTNWYTVWMFNNIYIYIYIDTGIETHARQLWSIQSYILSNNSKYNTYTSVLASMFYDTMCGKIANDTNRMMNSSIVVYAAIWRWRSWSTLVQIMAWCLTTPSHHLNQCWHTIIEIPWHLSLGNMHLNAHHFDP